MKVTGTIREAMIKMRIEEEEEDLLSRRDQIIRIESLTLKPRISELVRENQKKENQWTEACLASITVHRPAENEKRRTIVGGTDRVTGDANNNLHFSSFI